MERLTSKITLDNQVELNKCLEINCNSDCGYCDFQHEANAKLKRYEDAEEQFEKVYGQCYVIPKNSIWEVNGIDINNAIEKQVPKKPLNIRFHVDHKSGECSICGTRLAHFGDMNYCHNCGNKIDWEETNDAEQ